MGRLIYSAITSLDGYIADEDGKFEWGEPGEETHQFVNDLERPIGTYLYGRRLYEIMTAWEGMDTRDEPPHIRDFAEIWQAAEKIVYSRTLESVSTARTRIERAFDPEPCRPRVRGQARRRVPVLRRADDRGRRHAVPARQAAPEAPAHGRTPVRRRDGAPPLSSPRVSPGDVRTRTN